MAYISVGSDERLLLDFLEEWNMESLEDITPNIIPSATKIFVNGMLLLLLLLLF